MPSIHNILPQLHGRDTAAWKMEPSSDEDPRTAVTCDTWIVYAKWSHPLWPYHAIGMVALRDAPGLPPAYIRKPGATHELFVMALNPDHEPMLGGPLFRLEPINFNAQLTLAGDEAANKILLQTVEEIIRGELNPDLDGVQGWITRFGTEGFKEPYKAEYDAMFAKQQKGAH